MKVKKENGLAGVDLVIATIAIIAFSTIIVFLMFNNTMENVKLKKETLAMIYMTEIFENVGIEDYSNLANGNYEDINNNSYDISIENLLPLNMQKGYKVDITITNELENVENNEDIIKKIVVTLTYSINNKDYTYSIQRMKIKE